MRNFVVSLCIFITVIMSFIFSWYSYEPSKHGLIGRSVITEFGSSNIIHISRFGKHFVMSNLTLNNSKLPVYVDSYLVKSIKLEMYLYILCSDNMLVFNNKGYCILFYSTNNLESKTLLNYVSNNYSPDKYHLIYNFDDLDNIHKETYWELQKQIYRN